MFLRHIPLFLIVLLIFGGVFTYAAAEPDELIPGAGHALACYRAEIERLAVENPGDARRIRQVLPSAGPDRIYLPRLPLEFGAAKDSPVPLELREKYAEEQFQRARQAAEKNRGNLAMQLAISAIEANPDHAEIRKLFGFKLYENCWRTTWEVDRLRKGFVDHSIFGWMPKTHVERYEAGERFFKGRWVSAAEDAKLRETIANGWEVETEHYQLRTNLSLEEGVQLSRRLEHFYRAWKLLFFRFQLTDEALSRMFRGAAPGGAPPRHRVLFYRSKADYVATLQPIESNTAILEISGGYYHPVSQTSHFFPIDDTMDEFDKDFIRRTLYHEGTHQLFQETRQPNVPGQAANFWIIEGIALFMETFRVEENHYVVGDDDDIRLDAAKRRKLEDGFYVPFETLVKMNQQTFVSFPQIQRLYSQAAGMTHFLMLAEDGRYRDSAVQLLRLVYSGADRANSLSTLTGRPFKQLDEEYDRFLWSP